MTVPESEKLLEAQPAIFPADYDKYLTTTILEQQYGTTHDDFPCYLDFQPQKGQRT